MKKAILASLVVIFFLIGTNPVHAEEKSVKEEVIYSIMVDRFNNGDQTIDKQVDLENPNAYQGGDIQGITNKLDDIKDNGFTTISLSPIMANAPNGYHGYWIEDFFKMEEQFGTIDDMKKLVKEAHDRNIKVVLEFVTNYVAPSSPIVNDPAKADWTKPTTVHDTQWLDDTVTLNQDNPEVRDMLFKAATFWLEETNVDGYKLHAIDQSSPAFLNDFIDHVKTVKPDIYLLGDMLKEDQLSEDYLDLGIPLIENKPLRKSIVDTFSNVGTPVKNIYDTWKENGKRAGLVNVDNAYTDRFTREVVEGHLNPQTTWKLALAYMYTTPGTPIVFQGTEIPMDGDTTEEVLNMVQFNSGDDKIKDFMEKMSAMRQKFPVLTYGDFSLVDTNGALSVFKRSYEGETMFIALNNDTETKTVSVNDVPEGMQLTGLLGDNIVREGEQGEYKIALDRESVEVYTLQENSGLNWWFISMVVGIFAIFVIAIIILSYKQRKRERNSQ